MALNIQDIFKLDAFISEYVTASNEDVAKKYGIQKQEVSPTVRVLRGLGIDIPKKEWKPPLRGVALGGFGRPSPKGRKLKLTEAERERRRQQGRMIGEAMRRAMAEIRAAQQAAE